MEVLYLLLDLLLAKTRERLTLLALHSNTINYPQQAIPDVSRSSQR